MTVNCIFWKSFQFVWSARVWISFSQSITAGRRETRKLNVAKQPVPWTEIWKSWNFPKYWRWWTGQASKITKFARWRDFNALRRAHVSFTWLVEWLHPKSNSVYMGDCLTNGGRTIHAFSNFDHDFRDHKWCILKKFWNHCVRRCLNFISWTYHGWTLRNEKVIRTQATGSMSPKFGNHEIFQNIDAGERFRPLNSWNSLAGAISMPCGAPTCHSHDS